MNADIIIGVNPILELLRAKPYKVIKLFYASSEVKNKKKEIIDLAKTHKIPISSCSKNLLEQKSGSSTHQGVLALIQPRKLFTVDQLLSTSEKRSLLLLLDSIFDPHNVGAILRAAACTGSSGCIISKQGSPLTPVTTKASVGAIDKIPLAFSSNHSDVIYKAKKKGYTVIAAHAGNTSKNLFSYQFPEKTLLIIGSEGRGVHPNLLKKADLSLTIPMKGKMDSFNVSQAAAIFLSLWNSQESSF